MQIPTRHRLVNLGKSLAEALLVRTLDWSLLARPMHSTTVHRRPDDRGQARTAHKPGPSPGPVRHDRVNHGTRGPATQTHELPGQHAKSPACIFASHYALERSAQQSTASWTSTSHPAMLRRLRHRLAAGLQPRYILRNPDRGGRKKTPKFFGLIRVLLMELDTTYESPPDLCTQACNYLLSSWQSLLI